MAVALACAVSTTAFAQESSSAPVDSGMRSPGGLFDATPQTRKSQLSIWANLGWWYGFGIGGRYTLPLVADGFIPELNDSVELEFGGDFYFGSWYYGYSTIDIPVEGRWTFHILPKLALYAKVAVGVDIGLAPGGVIIGPLFNIGPGIVYNFSDSLVLRAEAGNRGLRAGVGFDF